MVYIRQSLLQKLVDGKISRADVARKLEISSYAIKKELIKKKVYHKIKNPFERNILQDKEKREIADEAVRAGFSLNDIGFLVYEDDPVTREGISQYIERTEQYHIHRTARKRFLENIKYYKELHERLENERLTNKLYSLYRLIGQKPKEYRNAYRKAFAYRIRRSNKPNAIRLGDLVEIFYLQEKKTPYWKIAQEVSVSHSGVRYIFEKMRLSLNIKKRK